MVNKESRAVLGKAAEQIGTYDEAPGGGTPLGKGEKAPSKQWVEEHRKPQPRNPDGTFGYNSQNAKSLKYGPSRGTTVPHFLRDVDLDKVLEKGTVLVLSGPNGIERYISTIDMTKEQLIENCKHFIGETGGFAGLHEGAMTKKMGRMSKEEKEVAEKGGGIAGKVDLNKISDKTTSRMEVEKANYDLIEKGLSGIDADKLLEAKNYFGVTNFNKKAVTDEQIKDRDEWRKKSKIYNPPTGGGSSSNNNPPPPNNNDDNVSAPPTPTIQKQPVPAGVSESPTPQYKSANFQGKNISSSKMNKIANLFKNVIKK